MNTLKALVCLLGLIVCTACQVAPAATPTPIPPSPTPIQPAPTKLPTLRSIFALPHHYAVDGPYQVGNKDFVIPEADGILRYDIYYPEQNSAPDVAHGPYPLVIFSRGLAAEEATGPFTPLIEPITSYGFVVIIFAPRGETVEAYWAGAASRPLDFQRMIDLAEQLTAPGGQLAGMIDTERIAATGISSGGWTALMAGGAQMDLGWCTANPDLAKRKLYN